MTTMKPDLQKSVMLTKAVNEGLKELDEKMRDGLPLEEFTKEMARLRIMQDESMRALDPDGRHLMGKMLRRFSALPRELKDHYLPMLQALDIPDDMDSLTEEQAALVCRKTQLFFEDMFKEIDQQQ
jgi:hypothetical protein